MKYNFDYISPVLRNLIEPAVLHTHRFEKKLGFKIHKKAYVAPYYSWDKSIGCVIDESGKAIKDSECLEWKENENYYQLEQVTYECKKVVYLGFLVTVFGHVFTDNLRKLWFLGTEECKDLISKGWELVYTTSWNRALPPYVIDIFKLAGFDITKARHITKVMGFDEVCIPDNSYVATDYGRMYCVEYESAINNIKKSIADNSKWSEKIYFTRSKYSDGQQRDFGEKAIEKVFKRLGYSIVAPEEYSVVDQIQMVRNCKFFAATEGSVAHLCLFCNPGTNVTIINKANYLNFHQVMINEYADLNVTYIEAHHSIKVNRECPWWGPFYLCVNRNVERYVGHPILHLPFWLIPSYWEYNRNVLYRCYNRIKRLIK
jgi:capsular polysaccharide biosynthesis protein